MSVVVNFSLPTSRTVLSRDHRLHVGGYSIQPTAIVFVSRDHRHEVGGIKKVPFSLSVEIEAPPP